MTPEETYELIEKYLQGDLSDADQRAFEKRLANDPELSENLEIHRAAFELVVDGGVLQAKEKLNRIHRIETGKTWKWKIYLSGLLVTALIGVGAYYYWPTKEQNTVLVENSSSQSSVVSPSKIIPSEKSEQSNAIDNSNQQVVVQKNNNSQKVITDAPLTVSNDSNVTTQKKDPEIVVNNHKPQDTATSRPSVSGIDCSKVKITGNVDPKASCIQEATGVIMINLGTVRGGAKPYKFSISEEDEFGVSAQYNQLSPGKYTVKVKDQNGCTGILETVTIGSTDCPKEYAFAPSRGEVGEIPVNKSLSGEIKILDRKGTTVYSASFHNEENVSWTGSDQYGQELPTGVYLFIISYTNGNSQRGHITILK